MFAWFFSLFSRKPIVGFEPCAQETYRFWNGRELVIGDPLAILRRLITDETADIDREMKMSQVDGIEGIKAAGAVADCVRRAFEVPSVKDGGLTDINCGLLLLDFLRYVETVKKKASPSPISAPPIPATLTVPCEPASSSSSTPCDTEPTPGEPCHSSSPSMP